MARVKSKWIVYAGSVNQGSKKDGHCSGDGSLSAVCRRNLLSQRSHPRRQHLPSGALLPRTLLARLISVFEDSTDESLGRHPIHCHRVATDPGGQGRVGAGRRIQWHPKPLQPWLQKSTPLASSRALLQSLPATHGLLRPVYGRTVSPPDILYARVPWMFPSSSKCSLQACVMWTRNLTSASTDTRITKGMNLRRSARSGPG